MLKRLSVTIFLSLYGWLAQAQEKAGGIKKGEEPTDFMRSNGKIYVVVAVIIIILAGLFLYLYNLDKKITAIEKNRPQP